MYAFIQDVPIHADVYEKIRARLGSDPPDGLVVHIALRNDDGTLRYVDVWRDRAACDAAFERRIHAAVSAVFREIGFKPAAEPHRDERQAVHVWLGS